MLESAVKVSGVKDGRPAGLTADRAELQRMQKLLLLSRAVYTAATGDAGKRVAKAGQVTAFLRQDGTVERALGEDGVSLVDDDGATVTAARGEVHLNAMNQPQAATLAGGVHYVVDDPLRQVQGEAAESHADFDRKGLLKHAVLNGAVHLHERRLNETGSQDGASERDLVSKTVDLEVATEKGRHSELQQAKAEGNARLTVVTEASRRGKGAGSKNGAGGKTTSVLSGDLLTGLFRPGDTGTTGAEAGSRVVAPLKTVVGEGHTVLRRVSESGAEAISSGDRLEVEFREMQGATAGGGVGVAQGLKKKQGTVAAKAEKGDSAAGGSRVSGGVEEIATAVQQGHVSMMNRPVAKPGSAAGVSEQHATAQRADYDGDADELTLTGGVQMNDADSIVWADKVVMEHETGDGMAEGAVRAAYLPPKDGASKGTAEPVHVLAARGEFKHSARRAVFYGAGSQAGAGKVARMWEGTSQVEAPVLELEQVERRLLAHGDGRSAAGMVVHAVFVSGALAGDSGAAKTANDGGSKQTPVRVASHDLVYDDVARRADFSGGVLVEDGNGTMRSRQAVVYLTAADAAKGGTEATKAVKTPAAQGAFMGGSVERIVASGGIEIVQPGRRVTGEQLVYTAADGMSVITGAPGTLPKMTDVAQGVITGASLRFHTGDNSVVVSNGLNGVPGQRVRTETRVK